MKVSIIVPIFNASATLKRMFESIKNQSWKDYELLLIDDGSTDDSLKLCNIYAEKDKRVKVYHQQNLGPSAARNRGLKEITGDFLMYVDADDVLHSDALEILIKRMEQTEADVCIFAWNFVSEDGTDIRPYIFKKSELINDTEELYKQILWGNYRCGGGNPWNKIWRVRSFDKYGGFRTFNESVMIYEDMLWTLQSLEFVKRIIFETKQLYDYYILSTSISRKGDCVKRKELFYRGAKTVCDYVCKNHKSATLEARKFFRKHLCSYLYNKQKNKVPISEEEKKDLQSFSIFPMEKDQFKFWIRFIYVRVTETFMGDIG